MSNHMTVIVESVVTNPSSMYAAGTVYPEQANGAGFSWDCTWSFGASIVAINSAINTAARGAVENASYTQNDLTDKVVIFNGPGSSLL